MSALRFPSRAPIKRNPQFDQKQRNMSKPHKFMPPSMGLNLKDALEGMKPGDALRLDNLIAAPDGVATRNGRDKWATGLAAPVHTLIEYAAPQLDMLFAVTSTGNWFDVSAKGPAVAITVPGEPHASGAWSYAQIQSSAGTFVIAVNGVNAPIVFNGVSWAAHALTFAAAPSVIDTFCHVFCHMGRLWFVAKNTSDLYYLGPAQIGGALTKFSVGALMRRGGYIVATNALTRDGGLGSDDLFVILTSKGEVMTYAGNNPASVNSWGLVGVYMVPPPIGRRCVAKMGSDLAILTTRGIVPMQEVIRLAATQQSAATLTNRINSALAYHFERTGTDFGWEIQEYPGKNLVILNVPISPTESFPYVMHAETGGWCRFTKYNSFCFQTFKNRLFSGDAVGDVWEYTETYTDEDVPIECEMVTAYDVIGSPGVKTVQAVRPTFKGPVTSSLPVTIFSDYDTDKTIVDIGHINITGPPWNVTKWNTEKWGPRNDPVNNWQVSMGYGYALAVGIKFITNDAVTITGVDILYEDALPL